MSPMAAAAYGAVPSTYPFGVPTSSYPVPLSGVEAYHLQGFAGCHTCNTNPLHS